MMLFLAVEKEQKEEQECTSVHEDEIKERQATKVED